MILYLLTFYYSFFTAFAGWIIYGYIIYFSDANDCQKSYDTSVALVFMIIFMFFGLILICIAFGLWFVLPFIYCFVIRP